ncbi:MAG: hypothetical protein WA885_16065 [Phormidesmis sp.]
MNKSNIFRKEALERLSSPEQLDQLMQIVTLRSWLPLVALGGLLGCGFVWSLVGRIPVTTTGRGAIVYGDTPGEPLKGVAYFSAGEIAQIQPGMKVLLIPDVEGVQVAGGLMARVKSVSNPPVTTLEAARESALDQTYIEVVTVPEMDANGDYHWSTGTSMMSPIAGMPAIARVTLAEKAPISFVFPFLE